MSHALLTLKNNPGNEAAPAILAMVIIGIVLFFVLSARSYLYAYSALLPMVIRRSWIRHQHPDLVKKWPQMTTILNDHFPYFKLLSVSEKQEFLNRLTDIRSRLAIEGREGQPVGLFQETMICASMVQLGFGYMDYRFTGLKKVIVYPDTFYADILKADVNGLTAGAGFVFISWKAFEEGYEHYRNKRNLGLHEFAHALLIFKANAREISEDMDKLGRFRRKITRHYEQSHQEDPMFRDYGLINDDEFWAVAAEVFFEQPLELRALHPDIYEFMRRVLKQDMARRLRRYLAFRKGNTDTAFI